MSKFEWLACGALLILMGIFGFEAGPIYGLCAIFLGVVCLGMAKKKKPKYRYIGSRTRHFYRRK